MKYAGCEQPSAPALSALAIVLLIGAERERRKGEGPSRSAAGIRTFAIASLIGAVTVLIGSEWLLAVAVIAVAAPAVAAYFRSPQQDPGLTTEAALILTVLLGALALYHPALAAAVAVAVLLASRERIHHFGQWCTQRRLEGEESFGKAAFRKRTLWTSLTTITSF